MLEELYKKMLEALENANLHILCYYDEVISIEELTETLKETKRIRDEYFDLKEKEEA